MENRVLKDTFTMDVPNKPEYVGVVRLTTSAIANRLGFSIDEIDDIKVAVAEACTNILENCIKEVNYTVLYELYENELLISVKGKTDNKDNKVNSQEGELGIFIIESLMDEVDFIDNDKDYIEISMIKKIEEIV